MNDLEKTLEERGSNYGRFDSQADLCQNMKLVLQGTAGWLGRMNASQRESVEMILHKIARIVNGDPNYVDSWTDIAGYATLVEKELLKDKTEF
jgi:hypothetical protein